MPVRCPALPEELQLPGEAASVAPARSFVVEALRRMGLEDVVDDAELAVTELVTNVVIHARTPLVVRVRPAGPEGTGARVEVHDGCPVLPSPGLLSGTAVSGRGLILVDALAVRWGAEPDPDGKTVWFEVRAGSTTAMEEPSPEDLLEMWAALEEANADAAATAPGGGAARVHVLLPGVATAPLLASRANGEDLLRELQLLLLGDASQLSASPRLAEQVRFARRLDAAARAAEDLRSQLRHQALHAVADHLDVVDLELDLDPADADAAEELSDALDEAVRLHGAGVLPEAEGLAENADFRRWCLREVAAQVRAAAGD
ncbi:anti-sigma regulatory factor (Ser/Thr protein kinase) [Kineococcus xinjiangensis]|uniref:Anti-sigma regulatory factor (Ser/Thr protein kinase) n=1 Tax=Kineococcus xinjiangensis TaxID=512762 RepID=A0A2S6IDN8_9ACTN|nr:ATP-binding protein [Kineococcus xinjiangensis]PPK92338.1 anti-sigma regulatory factor (Ser/Thr protein kinase) [Kineococcus xinjiangensis]